MAAAQPLSALVNLSHGRVGGDSPVAGSGGRDRAFGGAGGLARYHLAGCRHGFHPRPAIHLWDGSALRHRLDQHHLSAWIFAC